MCWICKATKYHNTFQIFAHVVFEIYVVYPLRSIAVTATVYMVMAITHERYSILAGFQRARTAKDNQKMLAIYLIVVFLPAIIFNLTKFFEVTWREDYGVTTKIVTALRMNQHYSIFYICWTRLIFCYGLPFLLMVFYSFKTYQVARL